ncbi:hypothetical protein DL771_001809 [Monosporascus sp. 5C6A]|nr:hypothetical protein DL771_001809 [Monosporascus sp. 5C6A]
MAPRPPSLSGAIQVPDVLPIVVPGGAVAARPHHLPPGEIDVVRRAHDPAARAAPELRLEGARARDYDRGHGRRRIPERPLDHQAQPAHEAGFRVGWISVTVSHVLHRFSGTLRSSRRAMGGLAISGQGNRIYAIGYGRDPGLAEAGAD